MGSVMGNVIKKTVGGVLLGVWLAGSATASVVVGNAPFAGGPDGKQSDQSSSQSSPPLSQAFAAPAGMILEAIRWWGYHGPNSLGSAYDSFSVLLGGVVQTGTLTVALGANGFDEYTFDIPDAQLTASSLTVINDSGDVEWFWQRSAAVNNSNNPDPDVLSFSLIGRQGTGGGTVDEPATPALVLAAAAALLWSRRRRGGNAASARG
jgi:hypothetical protein